MNDLFLAWQSSTTRRWFTVGRLRRLPEGTFEFVYTRGFRTAGMATLAGMPIPEQRYISETLFPHFQNRIMSTSREEYPLHLARLGLSGESDPLVILARSGGQRETDAFQVFPAPIEHRSVSGEPELYIQFFTHGFRYMSPISIEPAIGAPLFLMWDFQNQFDDKAVMIRTKDNDNLGYVPRYYNRMLLRLRELGVCLTTKVEHVNPVGSPPWCRVLCTVTAPWPPGFDPLHDDDFQQLAP